LPFIQKSLDFAGGVRAQAANKLARQLGLIPCQNVGGEAQGALEQRHGVGILRAQPALECGSLIPPFFWGER